VRGAGVRPCVPPMGGGPVGVDGSVGIFETRRWERLDFAEADAEERGNLKFEFSDFK
jgi:hypothetical protein